MRKAKANPETLVFGEVEPALLELLVCPLTKGPLLYDRAHGELISEQAGLAYPIKEGIPIMLVEEARPLKRNTSKRVSKLGLD